MKVPSLRVLGCGQTYEQTHDTESNSQVSLCFANDIKNLVWFSNNLKSTKFVDKNRSIKNMQVLIPRVGTPLPVHQ